MEKIENKNYHNKWFICIFAMSSVVALFGVVLI